MANASNFNQGVTPDSNPKRGNKKMANKIDIHLYKCTKVKKQCHIIGPTLGFSDY